MNLTAGKSAAGWYLQQDGSHHFWDGSRWTGHVSHEGVDSSWQPPQSAHGSDPEPQVVGIEQIAHDLAMVYLNNRYGAEVSGSFDVQAETDWSESVRTVTDVSGSGAVETERLPRVHTLRREEVKTGERYLFGLGPAKTKWVDTDEYAVDDEFSRMIRDYHEAYERFLALLQKKVH